MPGQAPEQIALLRLDTDWYESTAHEFEHLYPRLAPGGVLMIDDYGWWQGSRDATELPDGGGDVIHGKNCSATLGITALGPPGHGSHHYYSGSTRWTPTSTVSPVLTESCCLGASRTT